jgi:murein DD-endopeptidase MepM/ murein hydrolase activator NlpD
MKLNFFGTYFSASTTPRNQYPDSVCANNTLYTGYHTAVDLETTSAEKNSVVPVYAISDGTVRFAGSASGYGGLVIIGFTYQSQAYTAIYGHIDTRSLAVKVGDKVTQGQTLANLAPACSVYSGNNRKHLHFGLHIGTAIAESGYVTTKIALSSWIDPKIFFGL